MSDEANLIDLSCGDDLLVLEEIRRDESGIYFEVAGTLAGFSFVIPEVFQSHDGVDQWQRDADHIVNDSGSTMLLTSEGGEFYWEMNVRFVSAASVTARIVADPERAVTLEVVREGVDESTMRRVAASVAALP